MDQPRKKRKAKVHEKRSTRNPLGRQAERKKKKKKKNATCGALASNERHRGDQEGAKNPPNPTGRWKKGARQTVPQTRPRSENRGRDAATPWRGDEKRGDRVQTPHYGSAGLDGQRKGAKTPLKGYNFHSQTQEKIAPLPYVTPPVS